MSSLRHLAPFVLVLAACGGDDDSLATEAKPAVEQYATMAYTGYNDSLTTARALDVAVDAFLAAPSEETLTAAKTAWKAARIPYRETEAYRFYGGPIDDPANELEPRINAWPLDEAFIDSVHEDAEGDEYIHGGIINTVTVDITAKELADRNFTESESSVATGYHAVEFLLWGQDRSADGPGNRPYTDFVDGDQATLPNPARRREYLKVVTDLLVSDLEAVVAQWAPSGGAYRAKFVGNPSESLKNMLRGIGALSGAELPTERMSSAYDNFNQEDEHSCFSDTTLLDLLGNAQALQNVYLGKLGTSDGPGIDELVIARNPELDTKMKTQLQAALDAIGDIEGPFDTAILDGTEEVDGPRRAEVKKAFQAVRAIADTVVDIGEELGGIAVDIKLPE